MSLFGKPQAYLGVDIGAHGIKLVELHKTKGRPQLWTFGIADEVLDIHLAARQEKTAEELLKEKQQVKEEKKPVTPVSPEDPRVKKYAGLLKALVKETKATTRLATASLPVSYIFHAVVTLPFVPDKEIDHIVKAEVKKLLYRPLEEMQVVHQKIPQSENDKKNKYLRVLVTAAPRDLVSFYTAIFQEAGLQLMELETEAFALERSLVGLDKTTAMIVDIGAERTNFFIIDQGLPLTHRSLTVGGNDLDAILQRTLGLEPELVNQVKVDIASGKEKIDTDLFTTAIDPLVKEIEYGFDLFTSQTGNEGKRPEKIILTGGSAVFPFFQQQIAANFPLKVFVGDPWARVVHQDSLRPILDKIGPRMSVSIGLAMRNIL